MNMPTQDQEQILQGLGVDWRGRFAIRLCVRIMKALKPKGLRLHFTHGEGDIPAIIAKMRAVHDEEKKKIQDMIDILNKKIEENNKAQVCQCQACILNRIQETGHVSLRDDQLRHYLNVAVDLDLFEAATAIRNEATKRNLPLK